MKRRSILWMMILLSCLTHGVAAGVFLIQSGIPVETLAPVGHEVLWVESVVLPGNTKPAHPRRTRRASGIPDPVRQEPLDRPVETLQFDSDSDFSPADVAFEADRPYPVFQEGEEEEQRDEGNTRGIKGNPGDEQDALLQDFLRQVRDEIESVKNYPSLALWGHIEGRVLVQFDIAKDGQASKVKVVHSSGSSLLDRTALLTIEKIQRFPPVPPRLELPTVSLTVPLVYQIGESKK